MKSQTKEEPMKSRKNMKIFNKLHYTMGFMHKGKLVGISLSQPWVWLAGDTAHFKIG